MRACSAVANDGMVLSTETPRVKKARKIANEANENEEIITEKPVTLAMNEMSAEIDED